MILELGQAAVDDAVKFTFRIVQRQYAHRSILIDLDA